MNRKYFRLHALFWLFLLFAPFVFSQNAANEAKWVTIESTKKDLSFDVPENFLVNKGKENEDQEIVAFQNYATMIVKIINSKNSPKNVLKSYRKSPVEPEVKVSQFQLGNFVGDVHRREKDKKLFFTIYAASSDLFYSINISSNNLSNPTFEKFVRSIKIENTFLFAQLSATDEKTLPKIPIETLKTSPIILEVLNTKDSKKNKDSKKYEIKYGKEGDDEIKDENNYSRPMIILRKSQPSYTDSARHNNVIGAVKLKVEFLADGNIGDIVILSKLDKGLEKNAVETARKIKFLPAEIDGKPADITKNITYHFTIY